MAGYFATIAIFKSDAYANVYNKDEMGTDERGSFLLLKRRSPESAPYRFRQSDRRRRNLDNMTGMFGSDNRGVPSRTQSTNCITSS